MSSEYDFFANQVKSDLFVGRKKELKKFEKILEPNSRIHVLNIHSDGVGGIGKTKLVLQMQNACKKSPTVRYTKEIIDFYYTESRTKIGVMQQIANLCPLNFPVFNALIEKHKQAKTVEEKKELFSKIQDTFQSEYSEFSNKNCIVVIFFDTYEVIRGRDSTEHSKWLETWLFPSLINDCTRLIIAGRYPLKDINRSEYNVEDIPLSKFRFGDTVKFWRKCFDDVTYDGLKKEILNSETVQVQKFHRLAQGKPILLALFADWIRYENAKHFFSHKELLDKIESETGEIASSPSNEQIAMFEEALVSRFWHLNRPQNYTLAIMAFAYRRMTPHMLHYLIKQAHIEKIDDFSLSDCEKLLQELGSLSFVKSKEPYIFLLHDEMQRLVTEYWWNQQDIDKTIRKSIAADLVIYYGLLKSDDNDILLAERLYYLLYADLEEGFKHFISQFDRNIKNYRINHCQLLFQEIARSLFYNALSPIAKAEADLRSARWYNELYRAEDALSVLSKHEITVIDKSNRFYAEFRHECGVACLWLNAFDQAINNFSEAERSFRGLGEQYSLARELNWLGYACYRHGNLKKAEDTYYRSIKEFLKPCESCSDEQDVLRISNVYSNLNLILRVQGRFYEAKIYGEVAVTIAEKKKNDRELARFLNALGETYALSNNTFRAYEAYEKALGLLEEKPDPLLKARVLTRSAMLLYRHADYIYLLEYYRRGTDRKEALERFRESYLPDKEGLKKAEKFFEEARTILESHIEQPTQELADLYFYYAQYHTVTEQWEKAVEFYRKSEETAKKVHAEYREINAVVGQIIACYFMKTEREYEKAIQGWIKRVEEAAYPYYNLQGKMEIMRGNFAYERYLKDKKDTDLKEALTRYITACDYMYKFSKISQDRFYATLRIIAKRMFDLPPDKLPPPETVSSLKDIWYYDENERDVCQLYSDQLDEIIDFVRFKIQSRQDRERWKFYIKSLRKKIDSCFVEGKEAIRFSPVYAEMLLHSYNSVEHSSEDDLAEAYFLLAQAYFVNDNNFESHKNITLAFESVKKTDNKNALYARIIVRLGKILYGRGEYAKLIEHYRREDFKSQMDIFKENNQERINRALEYFKAAEMIFDQLTKNTMNKNRRKKIAYMEAHLQLRWAECLIISNGDTEEIEHRIKLSMERSKFKGNPWRQMNAIGNLINFYYLSGQWETRISEIDELLAEFMSLAEKQYRPGLMASLSITEGNVKYDQIFSNVEDEKLIENFFQHYIDATRHKAAYSNKLFYETIGILLDRIAGLPKESVKILCEKVYPRLRLKQPPGSISEKAYKLVEQCIYIHSEIL
jgi:hypothetical protein